MSILYESLGTTDWNFKRYIEINYTVQVNLEASEVDQLPEEQLLGQMKLI